MTCRDKKQLTRRNELDLYADDSPILEYSLSKLDDKCSIKVASHDFGEGSYGIGFSKETWLKEQFDRLILHYVEHGYIEDFKWRYMGKNRHCVGTLMTASKAGLQFGWDHTRGLFVVLLGTIGLSVVLLGLEHLTYFVIVPILKKRAQDSVWKSRNMEYFSQRLYKSINSEKVEPPAKVLLSKVRQTKFDLKAKMKKQMRSVPADMVSYQMKSQDLATIIQLAYKSARERRDNEGDDVFTVSGNLENDLSDDIIDIIQQISKEQQQQQQQQYRSKSIPNGETLIPRVRKARWSTGEQSNVLLNVDIETDLSYHNNRRSKLKRLRSSLYRSRKKKNSNTGRAFYNPTFEGDIEELPIENQQTSATRISGVSSMNEIRNPCELDVSFALEQNRSPLSDRVFFSKTDNCKRDRKRYETWPSPKTRRRSVTRKDTNNKDNNANGTGDSTVRIINEIPTIRCSSCSDSASTNSDLNVDLVLKDNRVKSSLRDHAMSTVERRSHSIAFDRGAVEALSKEDLLVLWKRSEIELQTRLNRTLHQNSHLRQLVHIAEVFHGQDGRANIESSNGDVANPETQTEEEDYAVTRL